jgi:hypothetical protein
MRWLNPFLALCFSSLPLAADPLSDADREALLEDLEKLRNAAIEKADSRFGAAMAAYRQAMSSDDEAMAFYLKCVEKVDFEDQGRKAADFREWKRRQSDRLSESGMALAMRHQLRWLVLTLRAASSGADRDQLAGDASSIVDAIFLQAAELRPHQQLLRQGVTDTVFARAYQIAGLKVENWPMSPVQLEEVYDDVVMPPNRKPDRVDALRANWQKRIQQESMMRERWSGDGGGRGEERGAEYETFLAETLPDLQWQMEVDLFRAGDQRAAAVRMLAHIEKNVTHGRAREWGQEFQALISPEPANPATAGADMP